MGKSLPFPSSRLYAIASRITAASERADTKKLSKPTLYNREPLPKTQKSPKLRLDSTKSNAKLKVEDPGVRGWSRSRLPLSEVVSDCEKRWFHDTLAAAKTGDISMMVLVGQMYANGYGVRRDVDVGRAWVCKASRSRSSALKVDHKQPGYNASDSDSDSVSVTSKK